MPKFISIAKVIQAGNGVSVDVLFIVPIFILIQGYMLEIDTFVSEKHGNAYLVSGVKHFVELEEERTMRELKFTFLNRSVTVFLQTKNWKNQRKRGI